MRLVHMRRRHAPIPSLLALAALAVAAPAAPAASETLTFTPEADTYVDSATPDSTHGGSSGMTVDGSPQKQAFVRFRVSGLAGRPITSVRLRMQQVDASNLGGRVSAMSSTTWAESISWNTRPAIDGPPLASFGAVQAGGSYTVELGKGSVREGDVSFGIDSTSSDGSRWATRESATPPQLEVTVDSDGQVVDGLSTVAGSTLGSSEPTYFSSNRRMALTAGGRLLTVYGRHGSGVQLGWRDPSGSWQTQSSGAVTDGALLAGTGTGDWPASIAVARDAAGREHAWVVWSGPNASAVRAVQMRRLTDLDAAGGPRVGPVVTVDPAPRGAYRADIAFERAGDGTMRACLIWSRRVSDSSYELVTGWFTDLDVDAPAIRELRVLETTTSSAHFGSLVDTPGGMRAVTRAGSQGLLRLYGHSTSAPLATWFTGASGPAISSRSAPTGVALSSGEVLAVAEHDTTNRASTVYRFSAAGTAGATALTLAGFAQPSLAGDGSSATLVGVRPSDGALISRSFSQAAGWSASDRVEVGPEAAGPLAWPNVVRQLDGRLRLVADAPGSSSTRSAVIAFQRPL